MPITTESSADYLQKVMLELQNLNSPSTPKTYTRSTANFQADNKFKQYHQDYDYSTHNPLSQKYQHEQTFKDNLRSSKASPREKIDLQHSGSESVPQYHEFRHSGFGTATKLQEAGLLGLTRAQLTTIYKSLLNKEPLGSISTSSNVPASERRPQIVETHLELPLRQPTYHHYYFLPLKTLESDLRKKYEHDSMSTQNIDYIAEGASQKQLTNPLFIAISTFISTAVLFMMGILFLPKLHQHGIFSSREIQDDFLHLTNIVMNAIDKFAD
ncbi:hypothetical protein KPH14_011293 [Odynerus spinipes]|uniref:Uncharacterized protein n=1 Tax=Odynerus spinipes TaxID=1348599 RepID=A0AAD9VJ54_9HYME|nr:hypothetical protein KPH14_011293 [Odynerus spinipes]